MRSFVCCVLVLFALSGTSGLHAEEPLVDKTLVAWVAPANLTQRGGSVLTLDDTKKHFDGIVFGEIEPRRWMAGSELFNRTERTETPAGKLVQSSWPAETATPATFVQIALVYHGKNVICYRNGKEYSRHKIGGPHSFDEQTIVLVGARHLTNRDYFAGQIEDLRIFDRPLEHKQLADLKPNEAGSIEPWAWWRFEGSPEEETGRFQHVRLSPGAKVHEGRLVLDGLSGTLVAARNEVVASNLVQEFYPPPAEHLVLNYHLMHPGGDSLPGDPNAAFFLEGTYHLHYILAHPWKGRTSFSFVHVTSPDMLHWTWQKTKLQPSFTGHGMFSGTGFLTKEGRPAAIYHGEASGRNQIAIGKDLKLSAWEKPFPVKVLKEDGNELEMNHWDPDCFLIGDTYYAISGGENPPLLKSRDLKTWRKVGDFLKHDMPDVAKGEDVSCANFFPIGEKWMLLCISHDLGCRYYIGDWDAEAEQFVPERHGRMNWRREGQSLFSRESWRVDFFAPESVLTPDGRRVMWAWCASADRTDGRMSTLTIQSLPRELSLSKEGELRIKPLREMESLRYEPILKEEIAVDQVVRTLLSERSPPGTKLPDLPGDSVEIQITIAREEAERKLFGFTLFADDQGGGLPILFRPETGMLRVGTAEAPFSVADLPEGEDLQLRIFVDRHLVEVFVNDRQGMLAHYPNYQGKTGFRAFTVGAPTKIRKLELWKLKPTNQGFREAQSNLIWKPESE